MTQIKFGTSQIKNPTPAKWGMVIQIFTVVASSVLAWVGTADFIGVHTGTVIQSILGLLIAIANGLKPFLGVETVQKDVPISNVTEMDTSK